MGLPLHSVRCGCGDKFRKVKVAGWRGSLLPHAAEVPVQPSELKIGLAAGGPCYACRVSRAPSLRNQGPSRHTLLVRVTHWITVISFVALLVTGVEILISHPRFYWGEVGNSRTPPLFKIPIPSSRATVPRLLEIRSTPQRAPDAQDESYFPGI